MLASFWKIVTFVSHSFVHYQIGGTVHAGNIGIYCNSCYSMRTKYLRDKTIPVFTIYSISMNCLYRSTTLYR